MRWLKALPVALALAACGPDATDLPPGAEAYLGDMNAGRAALEASLVERENGYAQLRLARYTPEAWGALPEWAPPVAPARIDDAPTSLAPVNIPSDFDTLALQALGRDAFHHWPVQVLSNPAPALARPADFGLAVSDDGIIHGLVRVELPDGPGVALTCAACHASPDVDGMLVDGRPNADFDLGALLDAGHDARTAAGRWGPGAVDVTADGLDNATVFTDLRPVRFQHHLHRTATVRNDLIALAVRIETLIITSSGQSVRPPRAVALGLAVYLWSLGKTLPPVEGGPGAEVFARACAGCHADAALAGDPVPLAMVAAASPIGESPERGTGHWRVPSLRGVGDRRPLLADASVDSLDALLDPRSKRAAHRFGRDLSAADRAALLDWLKRR